MTCYYLLNDIHVVLVVPPQFLHALLVYLGDVVSYESTSTGASTNDILHQYVSTIKALRTMDPASVFLEAVGEPIRDYLRGRRDTIKSIVTMMTDGTGAHSSSYGNP
ncbi:hypothetical protein JHK87_009952 [Glycine soja]|nr:hypothetical protein JHK87_009952 [Glycine soja]